MKKRDKGREWIVDDEEFMELLKKANQTEKLLISTDSKEIVDSIREFRNIVITLIIAFGIAILTLIAR